MFSDRIHDFDSIDSAFALRRITCMVDRLERLNREKMDECITYRLIDVAHFESMQMVL